MSIKPMMQIAFTCNKCKTRVFKTFSKHAYTKGLVIITCPGCKVCKIIMSLVEIGDTCMHRYNKGNGVWMLNIFGSIDYQSTNGRLVSQFSLDAIHQSNILVSVLASN